MRKKYNTYDLDSLILGRFDTLEDAIAAKHRLKMNIIKNFHI